MPKISLITCVYKERDLLQRMIDRSEGCYDELIIGHDGPEAGSEQWRPGDPVPAWYRVDWAQVHLKPNEQPHEGSLTPGTMECPIESIVRRNGGRFFELPRCGHPEPHWPFLFSQAQNDWILRLDADEYPDLALRAWLQHFRSLDDLGTSSGFTCIWPLWNGKKHIKSAWPDNHVFLFNRRMVRYIGLQDLSPIPLADFEKLDLVVWHEPKRKSYGYRSVLFRKQNWVWRRINARLLNNSKPEDTPRWNWPSGVDWPQPFLRMRDHTWTYMVRAFFISWIWGLRQLVKHRTWSVLYSIPAYGWHHAFICFEILKLRWRKTLNNLRRRMSSVGSS